MTELSRQELQTIRKCAVFSRLGPRELDRLLRDGRVRRWTAGRMIFLTGQEADRFFVILGGRVKVFQLSERGEEQVLHLYGPGESFGEAAMWAGGTFPAAAEVLDDARLLELPRRAVRKAITDSPELALGMLAGLSAKLREFAALIEQLSLKDVPARAATVLLREARAAGSDEFRLSRTKRQIAASIHAAPATLSRALRSLSSAGLIEVNGSRVRLLDPDRLRRLAQRGRS